jgi:hypothetical protein
MPSGKQVITLKELIDEAQNIVEGLDKSTIKETSNDELVVRMRDFFIALSKAASSYSYSVGSRKPPHPFKI